MTLTKMLIELAEKGCYPSIYCRGSQWRAQVNAVGNCCYWADADSPESALREAISLWEKAGCPVDGMACETSKEEETKS